MLLKNLIKGSSRKHMSLRTRHKDSLDKICIFWSDDLPTRRWRKREVFDTLSGLIEHICPHEKEPGESNRKEGELWDLVKKFNISAEKDRRSRPPSDDSVSKKSRDENFAKKLRNVILGVGLEIRNVC